MKARLGILRITGVIIVFILAISLSVFISPSAKAVTYGWNDSLALYIDQIQFCDTSDNIITYFDNPDTEKNISLNVVIDNIVILINVNKELPFTPFGNLTDFDNWTRLYITYILPGYSEHIIGYADFVNYTEYPSLYSLRFEVGNTDILINRAGTYSFTFVLSYYEVV